MDVAANNLNFLVDGNTLNLASPITVNNLQFNGTGKIISAENLITMLPGGIVSGASATSFTDGPVAFQVASTAPTTMTFPVGKGSVGRPVVLNVTQDASTLTTYTAEMKNPPMPTNALATTLESVSTVRYYNISKSSGANVTSADVTLNYSTDDGVGTNNLLLRIAKADGIGNWVNLGGTGTAATTGTITSTNFTDFTGSDFVLGILKPVPIAFAVTGGGFHYPGGFGLPVGLADSETGVTYTLFKDNIAQSPTIAGTGEPITFGDQLFGVYTVSGTNVFGTTLMTGSATITVIPLPALPNVALNKTATTQGTISTGYEPSKANDGNGTNSSYWNGSQYPKWWKVDLGGYYDLSAIVVRNLVGGGRYYQYNIEGSLDDQTYTPISAKANTNAATDAGDAYSVSTTARYLKVTMTYNSANSGVHISDFRAYGTVNASSYAFTVIAGTGGSISPSGAVTVAPGSNQTFTITPDIYYQVADVLVDDISVGAVTSYLFTNVTANHTISATFAALENVALNKTATTQGTISTGYEPSKANDGNGTNSSYWNGSQYPKWWKVDLGGYYDLSAIVVRNLVGGGRYYQYNIEGSLDDQTYTPISAKANTNAATDAGDAYSVSTTARYLKVNMTYNSANSGVHISDFRAYGAVNASSSAFTVIAGTGGSISPSGAVTVAPGSNQTFTITPDIYYQIADVLVDDISVGAVTSYLFTNVTANHTISATFAALENVALNKTATTQGTISTGYEPSKANDGNGTNSSYWNGSQYPKWWKVDLGGYYDLSAIVVRNLVGGGRYYQYNIEGSLDDQTYTPISAKANTNAATDAGDAYSVSTTARYLKVTMTYNSANSGVHISDFRAYGTVNASSYAFTVIAGTGGSISPSGAVTVAPGSNQTFTITPDIYYQVADVLVDDISVGAVTSYLFTNVTANHTISATFAALENVALNKTATTQGTISTGYEPSKANDGNGTNSSYWNGSQYPKWWKVDLGGYYDLSAIVVRNLVGGGRYYQYNIEGSLDDQTYTPISAKANTNAATDAGDAYSVSTTARYLKVNMTYNSANSGVHISDFRAYGTLQGGAKGSNSSVSDKQDKTTETLNQNSEAENFKAREFKMNVYPNPFRDHFTIRIDSPDEELYEISVVDLQGKIVLSGTEIPANIDNTFNMQVEKGMYIIRVNNKGKMMIHRIVKD